MTRKTDKLAHDLARFEGVFCSGFFIPDPEIVTALALLFDRIHFLNQLEYVIELSKHYRIEVPHSDKKVDEVGLVPTDHSAEEDPLSSLTADQRRTVYTYLYLSDQFFLHYSSLFPEVFYSSLLPGGEVLTAELVKKGKKEQLNTYRVTRNPLTVSTGAEGEVNRLISEGKIPIFGGISFLSSLRGGKRFSATQIASALAIKSVAMVLPGMRPTNGEVIRETRERLKDHLPPFWSAMLKLSAELSERLEEKANVEDLQREVNHAVSTIVRPALIDLVDKMEKERKQWFNRILSPVAAGLRVLAGKPPVDLAGLISSSLALGAVGIDVAQQLRKVDALKQEPGLTYILELRKVLER